MKDIVRSKDQGRKTNVEKSKRVLRFVCPICGSRDLRVMEQARHYPIAILDGVAVNAETLKFEELRKREEGPYWLVDDPKEEWECWCVECEFVPDLEQYHEEKTKEDKFVRWLLDNCPQSEGEDVKIRALTFTCPQCGGQGLDWVHDAVILRDEVEAVTADGEIVWDNSSYSGTPATEEYFQCDRCHLILRDEDGDVVDEDSLGQWLRANCAEKQQESARKE